MNRSISFCFVGKDSLDKIIKEYIKKKSDKNK